MLITYPATATLIATVDDEGWYGAITRFWEQLDGPGTATIDTPTADTTDVDFPDVTGMYAFQHTASNDVASGTGRIYVYVLGTTTPAPTFEYDLSILVNGVEKIGVSSDGDKALNGSLTITENPDETPNTASFTVLGPPPLEFHPVIMALGATRKFAGVVLRDSHSFVGRVVNDRSQVNCVDQTWHLTRRRVTRRWRFASASTIMTNLVALVPGFTGTNIQAGLPTLDEFVVTDLTIIEAMKALKDRVPDCKLRVDYYKDVHFGTVDDSITHPTPITDTDGITLLEGFQVDRDGGPVVNRVKVTGGGSAVSHTSVNAPSDLLMTVVGGDHVHLTWTDNSSAEYGYWVQRSDDAGNTWATIATVTDGSNMADDYGVDDLNHQWRVVPIVFGGNMVPTCLFLKRTSVFSESGGQAIIGVDRVIDYTGKGVFQAMAVSMGIEAPPTRETITHDDGELVPGDVHLFKQTLVTQFGESTVMLGYGMTVGAGNAFRLTGFGNFSDHFRSDLYPHNLATNIYMTEANTTSPYYPVGSVASDGNGSLELVILKDVVSGGKEPPTVDEASGPSVPYLVVDPDVVASAVVGESVNLYGVFNDTASQTAMATRFGGGDDGIIEDSINDGNIASADELEQRAVDYLAEHTPIVTGVRYRTHDQRTHPNAVIVVNLGPPFNVAREFTISQVSISGFDTIPGLGSWPIYSATADVSHRTLEDVLRVGLAGAKLAKTIGSHVLARR